MSNKVDHPQHYGGADNLYEAIKVIEAWELGFNLGNTVKYISRAGKKNPEAEIEDLEKASWYLAREIANRKATRKSMVVEEAVQSVMNDGPLWNALADDVIKENEKLIDQLGDGKTRSAIWTSVLVGEDV